MWLQFTVLGLAGAAAVWVMQRQSWTKWIKTILVALMAAILFLVASLRFQLIRLGAGPDNWYDASPAVEVLLFLVMLFGMSARYFTRAIERRREKITELERARKPFAKPRLEFDVWEFSYPLFVSVVTYGAVLSQLSSTTLTIANVILSFQTGFFWQTVLGTRQTRA